MGACYSATVFVERGSDMRGAGRLMREFIRRNDQGADWSLDDYRKCGITTRSFDGLMKILLAGWPGQPVSKIRHGDGSVSYSNAFDASYGWSAVMSDAFFAFGPALAPGSSMDISADDDILSLEVGKDGEVTEVKWNENR